MGGTNPDKDAGNGVIMRLSPVPVYWSNDLEKALIMTRLQTSTTHNVQETLDGSTLMTFMIWHGINGKNKTEIFEMIDAMWSVWNTDNFKDAVVKSVWLGGDCDTV